MHCLRACSPVHRWYNGSMGVKQYHCPPAATWSTFWLKFLISYAFVECFTEYDGEYWRYHATFHVNRYYVCVWMNSKNKTLSKINLQEAIFYSLYVRTCEPRYIHRWTGQILCVWNYRIGPLIAEGRGGSRYSVAMGVALPRLHHSNNSWAALCGKLQALH